MAQYQQGGWYPVGPNGKARQYWNGGWYDSPQQSVGPAQSSGPDIYKEASDSVNKYIDSLISDAAGQRDLILKKLDAEHKLALGNDDQARAKFLETVADGLEQRIGRIPYDYQRYSARELEDYAMGSRNIADNKKLALDKLQADDALSRDSLKREQTVSNQNQAEDLNSRGVINGQTRDNAVGVGGQQVGIQNNDFNSRFQALDNNLGFGTAGINLGANQQQGALDFSHKNKMEDLTTDARRGALDEQNAYTFGTDSANLEYNNKMKALERQRALLQTNAAARAGTATGIQKGILGS